MATLFRTFLPSIGGKESRITQASMKVKSPAVFKLGYSGILFPFCHISSSTLSGRALITLIHRHPHHRHHVFHGWFATITCTFYHVLISFSLLEIPRTCDFVCFKYNTCCVMVVLVACFTLGPDVRCHRFCSLSPVFLLACPPSCCLHIVPRPGVGRSLPSAISVSTSGRRTSERKKGLEPGNCFFFFSFKHSCIE